MTKEVIVILPLGIPQLVGPSIGSNTTNGNVAIGIPLLGIPLLVNTTVGKSPLLVNTFIGNATLSKNHY